MGDVYVSHQNKSEVSMIRRDGDVTALFETQSNGGFSDWAAQTKDSANLWSRPPSERLVRRTMIPFEEIRGGPDQRTT